MRAWNPQGDRHTCVTHYGNMGQLAGLKRYVLSDGRARGVEAIDVETGGGLSFTVLPGRGMDIAWARYRGVPIAYLAKPGVTAPSYHDRNEMQWLKSFFGGLVTTCGLSNAGPPCRAEMPVLGNVPFGLHGDISNAGADNVCAREEWVDGRYRLQVSGRVEEGRLHGEHLQMRREVTAYLGEKRLFLRDVFSNEGDSPQPLLFFYHINVGHPVLDAPARFWAPSLRAEPANDQARADADWAACGGPAAGYMERQYYHEMAADARGETVAALVNEELELGVYLRYNARSLPKIAQWKVLREGEYVHAFEPGNCHPIGREALRARGELEVLPPMQARGAELEIGIVDTAAEIEDLRREIADLVAAVK